MGADIVSEFRKGEELQPIVLLEVTKDMEELFNFLVDSFCFSINLGVEGHREGMRDFKFFPDFPH